MSTSFIDKQHLQGEKISTKSMYFSMSMLTRNTSIASLLVESESLSSLNATSQDSSRKLCLIMVKRNWIGLALCICKLGPRPSCRCVAGWLLAPSLNMFNGCYKLSRIPSEADTTHILTFENEIGVAIEISCGQKGASFRTSLCLWILNTNPLWTPLSCSKWWPLGWSSRKSELGMIDGHEMEFKKIKVTKSSLLSL